MDNQRLGKQRVEVLQLLMATQNVYHRSRKHPAYKMWVGYTDALVAYGLAICDEWIFRGFKDSCREKIASYGSGNPDYEKPHWLGEPHFHAAQRSNLLRKDPTWYGTFKWTDPPILFYVWPKGK